MEVPFNTSDTSPSVLSAKPSEANMLMAAATMAKMGRLNDPQRSMPGGDAHDPLKTHGRRAKLKVVK